MTDIVMAKRNALGGTSSTHPCDGWLYIIVAQGASLDNFYDDVRSVIGIKRVAHTCVYACV